MSTKAVDLNLLDNFYPKAFRGVSAFGQFFRFSILATVWISIVFSAAAGAGLTFAWLLPILIKTVTPVLLPNLSPAIIQNIAEIHAYLAPTVTIATVIPVNALFLVLCERKVLALLTMRMGPTKVGPNGFLQTMADALKLLFKEDIAPAKADRLLFFLSPALFFAPAMLVFLPLLAVASNNAGVFIHTNIDVGLLFIMAVSSMGVMSLVMAGWASNNKYSLIGGLRSAAQAVSYEIPMVLSIIAIVLMSGSINLLDISNSQAGGLLQWNIFGQGHLSGVFDLFASSGGSITNGLMSLLFCSLSSILFLVFLTASIAEVNRIPFDLPEAESELVSGFNTEFTGMKFALFFLAEYTNLFVVSALSVILFLGGSHLPISLEAENALYASLSDISISLPVIGDWAGHLSHLNFVWVITSLVMMIKIYGMIVLAIWIRATLPRLRVDQLMEFGWKYLIPLTIGSIFAMAILLEYMH